MTAMAAPTLVLICGYARAGKDTLASGILEWSTRPARKQNFADYLKDAGNDFLMSLNLEGDFHSEPFKIRHRDFLVAAGKLARSLDVDIFAKNLANFCPIQMTPGEQAPETVVCSDLRYVNEVAVCQDLLHDIGWKVRTIYVSTAGIGPANAEELDSIMAIREHHAFDLELTFAPNSRQAIMQEGRYIAKSWRL